MICINIVINYDTIHFSEISTVSLDDGRTFICILDTINKQIEERNY